MRISSPAKFRPWFAFIAVMSMAFMHSSVTSAIAQSLAQTTARQIEAAMASFETACHISILLERLPSQVDCGKGSQSIGDAWGGFLDDAGVPKTFDQRSALAQELGLNQSTTLCFVAGAARKDCIEHLLNALKK